MPPASSHSASTCLWQPAKHRNTGPALLTWLLTHRVNAALLHLRHLHPPPRHVNDCQLARRAVRRASAHRSSDATSSTSTRTSASHPTPPLHPHPRLSTSPLVNWPTTCAEQDLSEACTTLHFTHLRSEPPSPSSSETHQKPLSTVQKAALARTEDYSLTHKGLLSHTHTEAERVRSQQASLAAPHAKRRVFFGPQAHGGKAVSLVICSLSNACIHSHE